MSDADSAIPSSAPPKRRRWARAVRVVSLVDLAVVVVATALLWAVSERTWWGSIFTFLPRHIFLFMPTLLLICSVIADRWSILVNLVGLMVVVGPLMGGHVAVASFTAEKRPEQGLTVISCNMEYLQPGVEVLLRELADRAPDVVALQEVFEGAEAIPQYFPGWHILHEDQFWIGSRYPLTRLDICSTGDFPHPKAISVRIDAPAGPFILHDIHLTTPRYGFVQITWHSVLDGSGPRDLEAYNAHRSAEATNVRAYVDRVDQTADNSRLPVVVVGDFNTPSVSNLYREAWAGFVNTFEAAGVGFCYTAPCTHHRYWFNDDPWARIDHILVDDKWTVSAFHVGRGKGSDHRLVCARLSVRQ
jgi:endonuclease/exonuclease/phosphatase (EEP) superfamily protein YafD